MFSCEFCQTFSCEFAKHFTAPFSQSTSGWLLLLNIVLFAGSTSASKCYCQLFFRFSFNISLLNKTPGPHTSNYTSNDTLTNVFLWIYINVKTIFHCFISHKYGFTDVLQNKCSWKFCKIHRKASGPDSLDSGTENYQIIFKKSLEKPFLQNISERLLLVSIQSFYCFKTLLFQNISFCLKFIALAPWASISFLHRINTIGVKTTHVLKKFMIIL